MSRNLVQPGKNAVVVSVVLTVCVVLVSSTGSRWLLMVATGVGALAAISVLSSVPGGLAMRRLRVCLTAPTHARVGDTLVYLLHLHNDGHRTSLPLRSELIQPGMELGAALVDPLLPGGVARAELPRAAVTRGVTDSFIVRLIASDPLGLVVWQTVTDYRRRMVVRPRAVPAARLTGTLTASGDATPRPDGAGDLAGVREWRREDGARSVHWRSTARHGRLVVAEREAPSSGRVAVVLVGAVRTQEDEELLARTASASVLLRRPDRLTLVAAWRAGARPDVAPTGSVPGLLDWWAAREGVAAAAGDPPTPEQVLAGMPGAGGTLAVSLTSAVPETWWPELTAAARLTGRSVVRLP